MSSGPSSTVPSKLVLFPDTNIFIEAKDLPELPWEEFASQEIRLLVCWPVRREIDDNKTNSKKRVSERARKWNSAFKKLLKPGATPLILKESSPRVSLEIAPRPGLGAPTGSGLDLTKPDDELIHCTLQYRSSNPTEDARLFTGDTGPIGTAYEVNLPVIDLPDKWRRESEPSEAEKELKLLKANQPKPVIRVLGQHEKEVQSLGFTIHRYRSLTINEIDALIQELREKDPPPTAEALKSPYLPGQQSMLGMLWRPPSDQRISKYLEEEHPAWLDKIRNVLSQFGASMNCQRLLGTLRLALSNEGVCPAFSTKFTVEASGNISLLKDDVEPGKASTKLTIPERPLPPHGRFVHPFTEAMEQGIRQVANLSLPNLAVSEMLRPSEFVKSRPPHDKNAWYLKNEEGESHYTARKVFTCDEWRHHEKAFEETVWFKVDDDCTPGPIGAVSLTLHAQNLPDPIKRTIGFRAKVEDISIFEEARKFLRLL